MLQLSRTAVMENKKLSNRKTDSPLLNKSPETRNILNDIERFKENTTIYSLFAKQEK